jgi:hypothetical protein
MALAIKGVTLYVLIRPTVCVIHLLPTGGFLFRWNSSLVIIEIFVVVVVAAAADLVKSGISVVQCSYVAALFLCIIIFLSNLLIRSGKRHIHCFVFVRIPYFMFCFIVFYRPVFARYASQRRLVTSQSNRTA